MTVPVNPSSIPVIHEHDGRLWVDSREVAATFEKRHDNVLTDIDKLIAAMPENSGMSNFKELHSPHPTVPGRMIRSFEMTRDGFTLLAMGFTGDKALRFKLAYIEAFNAMEAELKARRAALPDFSDPIAAAEAWLAEAKARRAAEAGLKLIEDRLKTAEPKAAVAERIAGTSDTFTLRDAAKILGRRQNDLRDWMMAKGWLFRQGTGPLRPYAAKVDSGHLVERVYVIDATIEREERTAIQARITAKGLARLGYMLNREDGKRAPHLTAVLPFPTPQNP